MVSPHVPWGSVDDITQYLVDYLHDIHVIAFVVFDLVSLSARFQVGPRSQLRMGKKSSSSIAVAAVPETPKEGKDGKDGKDASVS